MSAFAKSWWRGSQTSGPPVRVRRASILTKQPALVCARPFLRLGDTNVADNDKPWQDMNPDEQTVLIRQISGTVNGLQFRVQDLEEAMKALQEKLDKRGD